MLLNVSYNTPEVFFRIDKEVGKPFGLLERFRNGGIGSPKLFVEGCSDEIGALFALDTYINTCNIELRPKGIIVRFRSILETFALPIPYPSLSLVEEDAAVVIGRDGHFLRLRSGDAQVKRFLARIAAAQQGFKQ